jgi:fatty acid-binding protein DegV
MKPAEAMLTEVSPVVGAHTGPGTVGLAWLVG